MMAMIKRSRLYFSFRENEAGTEFVEGLSARGPGGLEPCLAPHRPKWDTRSDVASSVFIIGPSTFSLARRAHVAPPAPKSRAQRLETASK